MTVMETEPSRRPETIEKACWLAATLAMKGGHNEVDAMAFALDLQRRVHDVVRRIEHSGGSRGGQG
jgi:hypothetical protein